MEHNTIDILVSFDKNYISPFKTMLTSLIVNNRMSDFHVWLLHSAVPGGSLRELTEYCHARGVEFTPLQVSRDFFEKAPVSKQYPQEMYYRLLAPHILPRDLKRVLYLDPDILVINSILPLWQMNLEENAFSAAGHTIAADIVNGINHLRLEIDHNYYNTGVMLFDLEKAREIVKPEIIFACVREHYRELILPDQDVFNSLYGKYTLPLDDRIWNYDARRYSAYLLTSEGLCDMDWVMKNTAILHFCGKKKPWHSGYVLRFGTLYKHYYAMAQRKL